VRFGLPLAARPALADWMHPMTVCPLFAPCLYVLRGLLSCRTCSPIVPRIITVLRSTIALCFSHPALSPLSATRSAFCLHAVALLLFFGTPDSLRTLLRRAQ